MHLDAMRIPESVISISVVRLMNENTEEESKWFNVIYVMAAQFVDLYQEDINTGNIIKVKEKVLWQDHKITESKENKKLNRKNRKIIPFPIEAIQGRSVEKDDT